MKREYKFLLAGVGIATVGYLYFRKRSNFFGLFKKKTSPKTILFVGDSITADPMWSYPALIRKQRPDLKIDVHAKSGQTTGWMLQNLPPVLARKKYDRVYIYGGVNDAFNNVNLSTAVSNVQKMIDLARQNGAEAYVVLGYEPNGFMDYKKMPITRYVRSKEAYIPLIARYKQLQSMFATQLRNATLIPKINLGTKTSDGTHPNGAGQQLIADTIKQTL